MYNGTNCTHILRLPISQHKMERGTFTSCHHHHHAAANPSARRTSVYSLIHDLNELHATGLCEDPVNDCLMNEEVFYKEEIPKRPLFLLAAR
jgi:hypothetical protein